MGNCCGDNNTIEGKTDYGHIGQTDLDLNKSQKPVIMTKQDWKKIKDGQDQEVWKRFGLFDDDSASFLQSLDTNVQITDSIAKVTLTQVYINQRKKPVETFYYFPANDLGVFHEFEAQYKEKVVKGFIKEKEKAKKEYKEGVEQGHMMAYAEIKEKTPDIMVIKLGNLPGKARVVIKLSYIQQLETSQNKFWKFHLLGTLSPRFPNQENQKPPAFVYPNNFVKEQAKLRHDEEEKVDHEQINLEFNELENKYTHEDVLDVKQVQASITNRTWSISATINTATPITNLFSPSHEIDIVRVSNNTHIITLKKEKEYKPNMDFNLLFRTDEIYKPQFILSKSALNPGNYCAMLSFIPEFNQEELNDCQLAAMKSNDNFDISDMDHARGEFVFLLDRSGSMSGNRIQMAKEALTIFLKSLPPQCFFNIISFGSRHENMFSKSQPATDEIIQETLEKISRFGADMGGTNLDGAIDFTYQAEMLGHSPKLVFLLTDGDVGNPDSIISIARKNSKRCRTFTIGIGNGASPYLCRQIAKNGRGKCELISDSDNLNEKMIFLLQASLSPVLSEFQFKVDDKVVDFMTPGINTETIIMKNEPIKMFVFLNQKFAYQNATVIKMSYYDSVEDKIINKSVEIKLHDAVEIGDTIQKLGVHEIIRELDNSVLDKTNPDIYKIQKKDVNKETLRLSLLYQALCKQTAFICKIQENVNKKGKPSERIIVPSLISGEEKKQIRPIHSYTRNYALSANPTRSLRSNISSYRGGFLNSIKDKFSFGGFFQSNNDMEIQPEMCLRSGGIQLQKSCRPIMSQKVGGGKRNYQVNFGLQCNNLSEEADMNEISINQSDNMNYYEQGGLEEEKEEGGEFQEFGFQNEYGGGIQFQQKSVPKKQFVSKDPKENLLEIIKLQKQKGYWVFDDGISQILGVTHEQFKSNIPKEIESLNVNDQQVKLDIWATVLILAWLNKKCSDKETTWKLIAMKSKSFLKKMKVKYKDVSAHASSLIH